MESANGEQRTTASGVDLDAERERFLRRYPNGSRPDLRRPYTTPRNTLDTGTEMARDGEVVYQSGGTRSAA